MDAILPETELVILAGGQALRMQGKNKLLQQFDTQIQLVKIYQAFYDQVTQVWVNSHRDHTIYQKIQPNIKCFTDENSGFEGPLMGMQTAWTHVKADYILFLPCDITVIPSLIYQDLHLALRKNSASLVAYVEINHQALYPFCLIKRSAVKVIKQHVSQKKLSLKICFDALNATVVKVNEPTLYFHSINSELELTQYQNALSI